jgi:predicted membrane-bound mannosyltransferase
LEIRIGIVVGLQVLLTATGRQTTKAWIFEAMLAASVTVFMLKLAYTENPSKNDCWKP